MKINDDSKLMIQILRVDRGHCNKRLLCRNVWRKRRIEDTNTEKRHKRNLLTASLTSSIFTISIQNFANKH